MSALPPDDRGDDRAGPHGSQRADELLSLLVGPGDGEPERLLHIARPVDGRVRVREWTSENWSVVTERELAADVLLTDLERAARRRRHLSQEIHGIRLWLTGLA